MKTIKRGPMKRSGLGIERRDRQKRTCVDIVAREDVVLCQCRAKVFLRLNPLSFFVVLMFLGFDREAYLDLILRSSTEKLMGGWVGLFMGIAKHMRIVCCELLLLLTHFLVQQKHQ